MNTLELEKGLMLAMNGRIAHDEELGITYGIGQGQSITATMPQRPIILDSNGHVAAGALATLLDTACGVGAMASLEFRESVATIDLRIDHVRPFRSKSAIIATSRAISVSGGIAAGDVLMYAEAYEAGHDGPVAVATGRFFRRNMPSTLGASYQHNRSADPQHTPYDAFLGFLTTGANQTTLPFRNGLIGNSSLPSLHGGVIAALIQKSATGLIDSAYDSPLRLASATVNYLRFGRTSDLIATASPVRLGRGAAAVDVSVHQGDDPGHRTATGAVTFVHDAHRLPPVMT